MATYLITGVAGFIGSHLADALLARGNSAGGKQNIVRGLDNFATGKRENIPSGVDFIEADLSDAAAVARACRDVDAILHQGALPSVPLSIKDPHPSHNANIHDSLADISATREAFGYRPSVSFEEGLSLTVDWCRTQLDPQSSNFQQVAPKRHAAESAALLEASNATT